MSPAPAESSPNPGSSTSAETSAATPANASAVASPGPGSPATATNRGVDIWWHLFFGGLLAINLLLFVFWAYDFVGPTANTTILIITILFAVFMAFNIGGNDVANSFGTSVGAGTLTMKQALVVAAVFEVSGAVLAGGEVTDTVRSGIVDISAISGLNPLEFAFIMMAALLGAAVWLLVATRMGWPVSTTHSIVGGIVGAALTVGFVTGKGGWSMVQWDQIGQIAISWVLSPVLGGLAAFFLFGGIKKSILVYNDNAEAKLRQIKSEKSALKEAHKSSFESMPEHEQISYTNAMLRDATLMREADWTPDDLESEYFRKLVAIEAKADDVNAHRALETWVPGLAALGSIVISAMLLFKGLKNLELGLSSLANYMIMGMVATAVWLGVYIFAKTLKRHELDRSTFLLFSWMQVFTAAAFAFSHGSNDIANALGPFVAILDVLRTNQIASESAVPIAVMITMGVSLVAGLWFIGRFVIKTVGSGLTEIHPASGFSAELSAAAVVMAASLLGLPVSSTHILIGAVLGVGIVNRNANWKLMKPIGMAWIITLPAAAGIAAITVAVLRVVFG